MDPVKKTTIINLFGGPGIGKSTTAADMYAFLKGEGVSCELVREYVKDWAWEQREVGRYDQLHVTGEQIRREALLLGKTNIVVTDSPVLIGAEYARRYSPKYVAKGVLEAAKAYYQQVAADGHEHIHVLLTRTKPYRPEGRYQSENDVQKIDSGLRALLDALQLPYVHLAMDRPRPFAEAVCRWNQTLNGTAAVSSNRAEGKPEVFAYLSVLVSKVKFVTYGDTCFICGQQADGVVNNVSVFECGHAQVMEAA